MRCDLSKPRWCPAMASVIQAGPKEHWQQKKKGLVYQEQACTLLSEWKREVTRTVSYHQEAWGDGVRLNSCPWCGGKLGVYQTLEPTGIPRAGQLRLV